MKALARAALLPALAALALLAAFVVWQHRLIYFPQRAPPAEWAPPGLAPWPSAQEPRGLAAAPHGTPRATAVVFHGNAGHAGHRAVYAQRLAQLGLRVILAEYPGYGPRDGAREDFPARTGRANGGFSGGLRWFERAAVRP